MNGYPIPGVSGRVILIGPDGRALLFRGGDPHRPDDGAWWFTPWGGTEHGETPEEAARRELARSRAPGGAVGRSGGDPGSGLPVPGLAIPVRGELLPRIRRPARDRHQRIRRHRNGAVAEHRWRDGAEIEALSEPVYPEQISGVLHRLARRRLPVEPWLW